MSLQLIYGTSGTGKSSYCFSKIAKQIHEGNHIYIITPEQFSYTQEIKLLENLEQKSALHAEVLTFHRMAYRVMQEVGGTTKTTLSKAGKAMLIHSILETHQRELTFLGKSEENIDVIGNAITEFKKHMISKEDLQEVIENTQNPYQKMKLMDLEKLYRIYEENIQNKYIDEEDILSHLISQLNETTMFQNTIIYIDEFVGFTKQEKQIIRMLLRVAKQVNVTICTDTLVPSQKRESDLFYSNKETALALLQMAREEEVTIEEDIKLDNLYRFHNQELAYLEGHIYANTYEKQERKIEHISLFLAKNPFSEMEQVAKTIITLVRDNDYKFKDIAIITKNLDTYATITKAIFNAYQIPLFLDEKKELSQQVLVQYVLAILEIFAKNWSYETVFNYLKTGLTNVQEEDIFLLESYALRWGIKGKKWYQKEWEIAESDEEREKLEALRKQVVEPLLNFKSKLDTTKTATQISKAVYEFLIENQIPEILEEKAKRLEQNGELELAREYRMSWDILMAVLDEIILVLREDTIGFERYRSVIKVGLKNSGLGAIPGTCDQVIMGDVERSRTHKVKAVFLLGLNDGVFPSIHKEEGYLNDADREYLKEQGLELAKGTLDNLYEENFNIYKAFSTAEEKLYLSYSSSDSQGKALRPSILVTKIKKLFPEIRQTSDMITKEYEITTKQATFEELLLQLRKYQDKEEINPIWFTIFKMYQKSPEWRGKLEKAVEGLSYTNEPVTLKQEQVSKLYGDTLKMSISRLEQYKRCGFSYYLKYGLQLNEKVAFGIESLDTGTFMHDVIDSFFEQVLGRKLKIKEMTEEEIKEMIDNIVNEKLTMHRNYVFTSTAKYVVLTKRLKKVVYQSMKYIIQSMKESDFEIVGSEVEFKKNANYPPITVTLEDGKKVELTGKIDRMDIAKNKEGKYLRIIDYKSSVKNIDLNEVIAGLQIQLLTYLDAVSTIEDVIPAGVLYFNLIDPIVKADKNKTEEEIEQEIKKRFKMQGLILADVNVVKMMDKSLEKGSSQLVPAYIDASGELSHTRSSMVTKEQFENLERHMNTIIKQIAKEMLSGSIALKPYYNTKTKKTPCEYCQYKPICHFNNNSNEYTYLGNQEKQEILDQIKRR